jgi:hypothetical protein
LKIDIREEGGGEKIAPSELASRCGGTGLDTWQSKCLREKERKESNCERREQDSREVRAFAYYRGVALSELLSHAAEGGFVQGFAAHLVIRTQKAHVIY